MQRRVTKNPLPTGDQILKWKVLTPVKNNLLSHLLIVLGSLLATSAVHAQTPIAHWSFDSGTLTLEDGSGNIIGARDQTGNHNATLGAGLGSASAANGGPTFNSNPIPG